MVDVSLFYSHFSSRKPVCNENYRGVGHAVHRFVDAIDRRFTCSPLLNRDCGGLFEFRRASEKALLRKNIALSLENNSNPKIMYSKSFAKAEEGPRYPRNIAYSTSSFIFSFPFSKGSRNESIVVFGEVESLFSLMWRASSRHC